MERLRYVARAGGGDPATIVSETAAAIAGLRPEASELVPLCRKLLERHPACGPLWWLSAHLLADASAPGAAWGLAEQVEADATVARLTEQLADDATVMVVGCPWLIADALVQRPDVGVLAVDAGIGARHLVRRLDNAGAIVDVIAPEALLRALARADAVLVEADACSTSTVVSTIGSGLAAVAAGAAGVPVWLIAGRGRRLPDRFVDAIARSLDDEHETFAVGVVTMVAGPDDVVAMTCKALAPECPAVPELLRI